jgi:hypothetical protein
LFSVVTKGKGKGKEKDGEIEVIPKEIIILPKPILNAVEDWEKIIKTGSVSFNFKERAKEYRDHVVKSDAIRKKLWESLKKGLETVERSEDGEPEQKKQKVIHTVTTASGLMDLFA